MQKIEYEIKLNELGRPYIELPQNYDNSPSHKFFAIEITSYLLGNVINNRSNDFNNTTLNKLNDVMLVLEQISDEIAEILYNEMKITGENTFFIRKNYHIIVEEYSDLYKSNEFIHDNVIYDLRDGLKAFVVKDKSIYMYNNSTWNKV